VDCKEVKALIHPYLDGELDVAHSVEVNQHTNSCASCAQLTERTRAVIAATRTPGLRFTAPPVLAERIQAALAPQPLPRPSSHSRRWQTLAVAASLLAVSLLGFEWLNASRESATNQLVAQLVDDHVRSLMGNHLLDVASTDKHTVRPWFTGKLDFAPPVVDLKDHDIPLLGGRLDVLAGRPVAALVYQHGKHIVNVFVRPSATTANNEPNDVASSDKTKLVTNHGFNVASWTNEDFNYSAVSDLNADELRNFASLLRTASPLPPK
jgi:anti-sigma factor RsiW